MHNLQVYKLKIQHLRGENVCVYATCAAAASFGLHTDQDAHLSLNFPPHIIRYKLQHSIFALNYQLTFPRFQNSYTGALSQRCNMTYKCILFLID
jgi:hypothetical protein